MIVRSGCQYSTREAPSDGQDACPLKLTTAVWSQVRHWSAEQMLEDDLAFPSRRTSAIEPNWHMNGLETFLFFFLFVCFNDRIKIANEKKRSSFKSDSKLLSSQKPS